MKRAFKLKLKAFFISFKKILVAKNFLRPGSVTLTIKAVNKDVKSNKNFARKHVHNILRLTDS